MYQTIEVGNKKKLLEIKKRYEEQYPYSRSYQEAILRARLADQLGWKLHFL